MKQLETLLYLNSNKIESSLFNTFLEDKFKIYSYKNIEELSEYIITDLACDLILCSEDFLNHSQFDVLLKSRKNLVVMSSATDLKFPTLKIPIKGLNLKEELEKVYKRLE